MNNRAFINQFLVVLFMIGLITIVLVAYFVYGTIAPVASYISNDLTNQLLSIPNDNNITTYLNYTVGSANQLIQNFEWMTYGLIACMFIVFGIMCFYVRTYPVLIGVWIILGIAIIFIAMQLSESYTAITGGDGYIQAAVDSWAGNNIMMQNMPWIIGAFIFIGGIIMFALITRDKDEELLL